MICKNCEINEVVKYSKYSNGEFCSKQCARSFSTKNTRDIINKQISDLLKNNWKKVKFREKMLKNNNFITNNPNINESKISINKSDSIKKISESLKHYYKCNPDAILKLSNRMKNRIISDVTKYKLSILAKNRCKNINERYRLRDIGRKGGFGKKGYTSEGIRYDSTFEKMCFEYLEQHNITFEPHKHIPNSSKVSDIYLFDMDIWIELDGINREKKKVYLKNDYFYWKEKLQIYNRENLKYKIFLTFDEFKEYMVTLAKW